MAKSWQTSAVRQILCSGRIAGLREHHGQVIGHAVWPAIITPAERDCVLARIAARSVTKTRAPRTYLLSGLLRCGRCGNRLFSQARHVNPDNRCHAPLPDRSAARGGRQFRCWRAESASADRRRPARRSVTTARCLSQRRSGYHAAKLGLVECVAVSKTNSGVRNFGSETDRSRGPRAEESPRRIVAKVASKDPSQYLIF